MLKKILKYVVPVLLTVVLVWFMFHEVKFDEIITIIRRGCDFRWILLAMLISIGSHVVRAARWQLQLRPLGINPPFMALCCAIFGCYALNLVVPRLGEIWRCTYIGSKPGGSFTKVFGSMVADRLADSAAVLVLLLLTFVVAHSALLSFLDAYPVGRGLVGLMSEPLVWAAIVVVAFIIFAVVRFFGDTKPVRRMREWVRQIWQGFSVVAKMPKRGLFLLYTVLLWGCYFLQLYVAFFAFDFTAALCSEPSLAFGLQPCLVTFVLSSIGMAIPSNGGLGPWNIAVMFGLAIYGISDANGYAFSIVQWSGQTVMLILLGILTAVYIARSTEPHGAKDSGIKN